MFSFRKPDAADVNLLSFLTDFSDKNKKQLKVNLISKFKLEPAKKVKKKKFKNRILEDGNDDILQVKKLLN